MKKLAIRALCKQETIGMVPEALHLDGPLMPELLIIVLV